ncbi:MAG: nucleotide sugar dehydrogenase [Candidatus Margulisbacteria bacterium]|nr:nucleotide sugar dehydrogenase [Candidatus Margulisiibacteriota bacterium]MBU1021105.1 nucleotide sugar dehydrogenase [Candidatus Margulisiibacteriota bacterium]MBU1728660.1 nucleotide sugar dehydrogenase [Candidatus Margulisiibacteriota bacterium]MBU1955111.1 nucleotide sugar dehydrogenase [Candidatus Margulisiibacteriota bacterium]
MSLKYDICVVGGCGHVGLPLAAAFAKKGLKVCIYDINAAALKTVQTKKAPFLEKGLDKILKKTVDKTLFLSNQPAVVSQAKFVVVVIGTPVDEYLNPKFNDIRSFFIKLMPQFRQGQILILRSTVFPGTSALINKLFKKHRKQVEVTFCPERIAEGKALEELSELPQLISGFSRKAITQIEKLFSKIAKETIELTPLEAELAKIFINSFRYLRFAIANQFFQIANSHGVEYYKIYHAITHNYPRAKGFAKAGFAAGPCLLKDTMQLAAFSRNTFFLGHAAMLINEGLPNYIMSQLKLKFDLAEKKVGILGMAFKGDSDDPRDSLSYKLKKLLELESQEVFCQDAYIKDKRFVKTPQELIRRSDIVIIGTPHTQYRKLTFGGKQVVDIWDLYGKGVMFK